MKSKQIDERSNHRRKLGRLQRACCDEAMKIRPRWHQLGWEVDSGWYIYTYFLNSLIIYWPITFQKEIRSLLWLRLEPRRPFVKILEKRQIFLKHKSRRAAIQAHKQSWNWYADREYKRLVTSMIEQISSESNATNSRKSNCKLH